MSHWKKPQYPQRSPDALRRAELAQIHLARNQLAIDEDLYRAIVTQISDGRTSSSANLSPDERAKLLKHFKAKGFKPTPPKQRQQAAKSPSRPLDQSDGSQKVRALWLLLHALGQVRNPSEASLAAYIKRMERVDDLRWLKDYSSVIEGLKAWAMDTKRGNFVGWIQLLSNMYFDHCERRKIETNLDVFHTHQALLDAHFRGVKALFDYCWPLYEALRAIGITGIKPTVAHQTAE